jgi:carbon-monoxide dehydrogenase medium subunit
VALPVLRVDDRPPPALRLGIGGAEAVPRRLAPVEAMLVGATPGKALFRAAADGAAAAIDPLTDGQTDASYRRELVAAMVYRALIRAAAKETPA